MRFCWFLVFSPEITVFSIFLGTFRHVAPHLPSHQMNHFFNQSHFQTLFLPWNFPSSPATFLNCFLILICKQLLIWLPFFHVGKILITPFWHTNVATTSKYVFFFNLWMHYGGNFETQIANTNINIDIWIAMLIGLFGILCFLLSNSVIRSTQFFSQTNCTIDANWNQFRKGLFTHSILI